MSLEFQHPTNQHVERVYWLDNASALAFGLLYFAVKGIWRHVVVQLLLIVFFAAALGPAPIVLMWLIYAASAQSILAAKYRRDGWIQVGSYEHRVQELMEAEAKKERPCPFCAEPVKPAAIKCRHCGSDLTPAK